MGFELRALESERDLKERERVSRGEHDVREPIRQHAATAPMTASELSTPQPSVCFRARSFPNTA